jgi:predicted PurR-regulated permease PerM
MAGQISARQIARIVLIVVAVAISLYLLWLLRKPIGWLIAAAFIAVALSGPVNWLDRRMRRGLAIAIVYVGLFLVPIGIAGIVLPPIVEEGNELARNAPEYARDARDFVQDNRQLRDLDEKYGVIDRVEEEAAKLPGKIGDAAGVLRDIGFGVVNSVFALVTILILAAFLLGSGRGWVDRLIDLQPAGRRARLRRVVEQVARAVGNYVAGALAVATIAGVLAYVVLWILGVDFRAPLALLVAVFSLIPLIGATIAAVIVGIVTLFTDFPTATIVWTIWAIVYQQIENTLVQPQIQKRAVDVHPFVVLVAVLFGSTLLGVIGAIAAIPMAATIQILIREWWAATHPQAEPPGEGEQPPPGEPPSGEPPPAEPPPAGLAPTPA